MDVVRGETTLQDFESVAAEKRLELERHSKPVGYCKSGIVVTR